MYKWIVGGVILLSVMATLVVLKFGLRPKPVPIIKPSNFEHPEKLAIYINRQLYQKLRTSSPLVFGLNKENAFEKKTVDHLVEILSKDLKDNMPEFVFLSADETFSGSNFNRQEEIRQRYGPNFLAFSIINLKGVSEAPEIINCEQDHTYGIWLQCMKEQKVRQINKARKVDLKKPVGIVETQAQRDILIYIRE